MDLTWIQSILYGFLSGLTDILPVSAQAHRVLLLKFLGLKLEGDLLFLFIHLGCMGALYMSLQSHLIRMNRARALARVPKKKRNRPLDTRSLMDWSMIKTMAVPVILALLAHGYARKSQENLIVLAVFLFLNGIILYAPQFFPTGNRDSRTLSRVEGLLMGLGSAVSVVPGISGVGAAASIGSICGVERSFALTLALFMNLLLNGGFAVYDIRGIANTGVGDLSFGVLAAYLLAGIGAFLGCLAGIRLLRKITEKISYVPFAFYCWGLALFTFIINLIA